MMRKLRGVFGFDTPQAPVGWGVVVATLAGGSWVALSLRVVGMTWWQEGLLGVGVTVVGGLVLSGALFLFSEGFRGWSWSKLRSIRRLSGKLKGLRRLRPRWPFYLREDPPTDRKILSPLDVATIEEGRTLYKRYGRAAYTAANVLLTKMKADLAGKENDPNPLTRLLDVPLNKLEGAASKLDKVVTDGTAVDALEVNKRICAFFRHYTQAVRFIHELTLEGFDLTDPPYEKRFSEWRQRHEKFVDRMGDTIQRSGFQHLKGCVHDARIDRYFWDSKVPQQDRIP